MQLALVKFRKPFMNCLVCQYPEFDVTGREIGRSQFKFTKIGEISPDLDNRAAYAVLSKYGDMLKEVRESPTPSPTDETVESSKTFGNRRAAAKRASAPQNK